MGRTLGRARFAGGGLGASAGERGLGARGRRHAAPCSRDGHAPGHAGSGYAGVGGRGRGRGHAPGAAWNQPVGGTGGRAGPADPEPAELCARPADIQPRLWRPVHLRRARRASLCGRHPGHHAGWAGADVQHRHRFDRPRRGAARPVFRAVRQFIGRRDPGLHRRRGAAAHAIGKRLGRQRRHMALWRESQRRRGGRAGLRAGRVPLHDRWLPRP
ncbi:hypothetical protein D3C71_1508630 [compost metagenome]